MDRSEALSICKNRARARKLVNKFHRLMMKSKLCSAEFYEYQKRYNAACQELENSQLTYKQALSQIL